MDEWISQLLGAGATGITRVSQIRRMEKASTRMIRVWNSLLAHPWQANGSSAGRVENSGRLYYQASKPGGTAGSVAMIAVMKNVRMQGVGWANKGDEGPDTVDEVCVK